MDKVPELRQDELAIERLGASLEANVSALLHLTAQSSGMATVEAPAGAVRWDQRLAQRGVPFSAPWRSCHPCTDGFAER